MELWQSLLYRNLEYEGDVQKKSEYLQEAYLAGKGLTRALQEEIV